MITDHVILGLILLLAFYLFWTQKLRTDLTALLVMLTLIIPWPHPDGKWSGVLTYQEGFSGFGSVAVVMVTAMFVFGAALVRTGAVEGAGGRLFRLCSHRGSLLQFAILGVTTFFSMFVNDTTVVLVSLPFITAVCKEKNYSPSRYLLFAAYGSLLGGQWTLIGTRSNIVISDYLRQRTQVGLGFFDFTLIATVIFVACAAYFLLWGKRLLPRDERTMESEWAREYLTEILITTTSSVVGKLLGELDWTKRDDLTVVDLIRENKRKRDAKQIPLQPGDVLIVKGSVSIIGELLKSSDFKLKEEHRIDDATLHSVDLVIVEALLPPNSQYVGYALEEMDFQSDYGFTVMGISRHGKTIHRRPMATPLAFGDSLLLLGHQSDSARLRRNPNLILLGQEPFPAAGKRKATITMLLLLGVIITAVAGVLHPAVSIPLAAVLAILLGCVKIKDAYDSVDWPAVVIVAGMIPFGMVLEKTGAAAGIAHQLVAALKQFGPTAVLSALLLLAVVLTQLIENTAVAIVLAPLAFQVAKEMGADPKPFMIGLAICVSSAFCTPVVHESTILVMGPGRYQFKHYLQIGSLMALLTWLLATLITPLVWPFSK